MSMPVWAASSCRRFERLRFRFLDVAMTRGKIRNLRMPVPPFVPHKRLLKWAGLFMMTIMLASGSAKAQDPSFLWSSKNCDVCDNTIIQWHPGWPGLFMEGRNGTVAYAAASVGTLEGNLVVTAVVASQHGGPLTVNLRRAVTLETNSGANVVLYPVDRPDPKIPKSFVGRKKEIKDKLVTLKADAITAGYLFFARDDDASRITVVIQVANEVVFV